MRRLRASNLFASQPLLALFNALARSQALHLRRDSHVDLRERPVVRRGPARRAQLPGRPFGLHEAQRASHKEQRQHAPHGAVRGAWGAMSGV